ncbi:hypothetical protein SKM57_03635 [Acinetobacter faecalis]|uniref:hypothetical protein n=1 Tax=Acinetobacter faecalis TaxID=2665161 RepID=UPI002A912521|nr:hypothetical protein [Acinetobacter faecalis]MDY6467679.1 hypothetical protein [Acinetobacter faecalis]
MLKFFIKNVGLDKAVFVKVILNNKIVVRETSRLVDDLLVDYFLRDEEYEKLLKEKELSFDISLYYQDIYGESFSNIYVLKIVSNEDENTFSIIQN